MLFFLHQVEGSDTQHQYELERAAGKVCSLQGWLDSVGFCWILLDSVGFCLMSHMSPFSSQPHPPEIPRGAARKSDAAAIPVPRKIMENAQVGLQRQGKLKMLKGRPG
jgi:hypothetical protein